MTGVNWTSINTDSFSKCLTETSWVIVPEPITRSFRESWEFPSWVSCVNWVSSNKGRYRQNQTQIIPCSTIDLLIARFLPTRSWRVSPGFCGAPAVITTRSASAQSSYLAACDFLGEVKASAWLRSSASPNCFFKQFENFDDTALCNSVLRGKSVRWIYGTVTDEDN